MTYVLDGVRVLDLSRWISGPLCSTILGDMGAEVIRVEHPAGSDDRYTGPLSSSGDNLRYLMLGRNKKGITLDISAPKGAEILDRLVQMSDIVIENYSPPAREAFGLTYEALKAVKPDIIVANISAFGSTGPDRDRPGFDRIAQAESGTWSLGGDADRPPVVTPVQWVDMSTALYTTVGVVLALLHRNKTGEGQQVETALLDTAVSHLAFTGTAGDYEVLGISRGRSGNSAYYCYCDAFEARDGMVTLLAIGDPTWRRLARLIGQAELANAPRFEGDTGRWEHQGIITPLVAAWIAPRTVAEVLEAMGKARIPCGVVNDVAQMLASPQVAARALFQRLDVPGVGSINHPRVAVQMSRNEGRIASAAPGIGEHNRDVFGQLLGLSDDDVASLRAEGIV